jgi:hypothetical protein
MAIRKNLVSLTLSAVLVLAGCSGKTNDSRRKPSEPVNFTVLTGKPLSVSHTSNSQKGARDREAFSLVIEYEGKAVLCRSSVEYEHFRARGIYQNYNDAEALVLSEMNDGDDEPISVSGVYDENSGTLQISSIRSNNYSVVLPQEKRH